MSDRPADPRARDYIAQRTPENLLIAQQAELMHRRDEARSTQRFHERSAKVEAGKVEGLDFLIAENTRAIEAINASREDS